MLSTIYYLRRNKYQIASALALVIALALLWSFLVQRYLLAKEPIYTEGLVGQPGDYNALFDRLLFATLNDLTEELKIENEGKDYIFKLKQEKWSSGEPINTEDIIRNLERAPEFTQLQKEIVDDRTIKISLGQPFSPLEQLTKKLYIYPTEYTGPFSGKKTNGLYKVATITKKENRISQVNLECKNNNSCWSPKLYFRFYPSQTDVVTAAKLGEITAFTGAQNLANWEEIKAPIRGRYYALFFNLRNEVLQDQNLRLNLAQKTPYSKILNTLKDQEATAAQSPLDYTWADNDHVIPSNQYDKELSKNYNIELTLVIPTNRQNHTQIAEILRDEWLNLGVALNIESVDLNNLAEEIIKPHNYDLLLLGHEVGRDPDRYAWWHSTQADFPGLNFSGYENMRADRALEEGRKVLQKEVRIDHYQNFEEVLLEDVPAIFLYHPGYSLNVKAGTPKPDLSNLWLPEDRLSFH